MTEQRSPTPYSFILPGATGTRLLMLRERAYIEPGSPWADEIAPVPSRYLKVFFTDLAEEG